MAYICGLHSISNLIGCKKKPIAASARGRASGERGLVGEVLQNPSSTLPDWAGLDAVHSAAAVAELGQGKLKSYSHLNASKPACES